MNDIKIKDLEGIVLYYYNLYESRRPKSVCYADILKEIGALMVVNINRGIKKYSFLGYGVDGRGKIKNRSFINSVNKRLKFFYEFGRGHKGDRKKLNNLVEKIHELTYPMRKY